MKKTFLALIAVIAMILFTNKYSLAQSVCDSSFKFIPDTTHVLVDTANGHHYSELYDTSGFTWEAWVNLDDTGLVQHFLADNDGRVIIAAEDIANNEDIWLGTGWDYSTSTSRLYFIVKQIGSGGSFVDVNGSYHLLPHKWYYVTAVCTYSGSSPNIALYVNGVNVGTTMIPSSFTPSLRLRRDIPVSIGNFNSDLTYEFSGLIDEVKLWKGTRTSTQMLTDSAGCTTLPQAGLVAYFKANEGTGSYTASSSSANFYGTNTAGWGKNAPVRICEPSVSITSSNLSYCPPGGATITVQVTGFPAGSTWSIKLSDSSVISGTADTSGGGSGSIVVHPFSTTTYTIVRLVGYPCAILTGSMTVTVLNCCPANVSVSVPRCPGTASTISVTDDCGCVDTGHVNWSIKTPSGTYVYLSGSVSSYNFPAPGTYIVCVSWSDKCRKAGLTHCDTITIKCCTCTPEISIPSTACTKDSATLSITDICNSIDRSPTWTITDPLYNTTSVTGSSTTYAFSLAGTYTVCVGWTDKCAGVSYRHCDTVVVTPCCTCDMALEGFSSTDDRNGTITGKFHLNSGSKRVVAVEMSIPYFDYQFDPSTCNIGCSQLYTGTQLGNFIKLNDLDGVTGIFPVCNSINNNAYAREIDWNYTTPVNINDDIVYYISTPISNCNGGYYYCVKILIRYEDCSSCECTVCFKPDNVSCGCGVGAGKANNNHKTTLVYNADDVKIYPNPNGGQFTIAMGTTTTAKIITIVDMTGRTISRSVVDASTANFELNNIPTGVYNVVITGDGTTVTKRLVVTK